MERNYCPQGYYHYFSHSFLAILEKVGLVDLLVRLINKLYPTQHYFEVYAWMIL